MDFAEEEEFEFESDGEDVGDTGTLRYSNSELGITDEPSESKPYQVLREEEVIGRCQEMITYICDVCDMRRSTAASLLRHVKWNPELVVDQMTDDHSRLKLMKAAGLSGTRRPTQTHSTSTIHCLVCYEVVVPSETFCLNCLHYYCISCWRGYLTYAVQCGAGCVYTRCMFPDCKELVEDDIFKQICSPDVFQRYEFFFFRQFVADNVYMKWCPAPGCQYIIQTERRQMTVKCECGFAFCFACASYDIGDHMPATCDQVAKWLEKETDESENVKWMLVNTKKCPVCRAPIEKNGGCMHMTCSKSLGGCGHEFCWLCRGPWKEHGSNTGGYYKCNRYDESTEKTEETKVSAVKTELERYMFHYHRYESHRNAHKIANKQLEQADEKGKQLQDKFSVRPIDTVFLVEATQQLLRNRRVLEFSYIYGYYLTEEGPERNLFLYLQEDLEKHTNALSTLYERCDLRDYSAFYAWKEQVANYTNVTKKFLEKFVEGVSKGLTAAD